MGVSEAAVSENVHFAGSVPGVLGGVAVNANGATNRGLPSRFAPETVTSVGLPRRTPSGPTEAIWGGAARAEVAPNSTTANASVGRVMGGVPGREGGARAGGGAGQPAGNRGRTNVEARTAGRPCQEARACRPWVGRGLRVGCRASRR